MALKKFIAVYDAAKSLLPCSVKEKSRFDNLKKSFLEGIKKKKKSQAVGPRKCLIKNEPDFARNRDTHIEDLEKADLKKKSQVVNTVAENR